MNKPEEEKTVEQMVRDEMHDAIKAEIASHPEKYVISREKFSLVEEQKYQYDFPGSNDIPGMDYDEDAHGRFLRKLPHQVKVKTYSPLSVEVAPGTYHVTECVYFDGKKEFGSWKTSMETLTWDTLKKDIAYGKKLCQTNEKEGRFFPKDILLVNDGKSPEKVLKVLENNGKVIKLLHDSSPKKENPLLKKELTDEEKVYVYLERQTKERYKNTFLHKEEPKVHMDKPFRFITNRTEYNMDDVKKYADVLILNKDWKKSPLDKNVTVYTFTPHDPNKETPKGFSNKGYEVSETVYRDGKPFIHTGCIQLVDVTEKDFKLMEEYEKKLYAAHQKAHGKFYPPFTNLPKEKTGILKKTCSKVMKKVKGIHRKQGNMEHQR